MTKDFNPKAVYRSDQDNILEDFIVPCFKKFNRYDRASGFFSSSLIYNSLEGISHFIENQGKIRLIIGAYLSDKDKGILDNAHEILSNQFTTNLDELLGAWESEIKNELFWKRIDCFSYLILTGKMEVKVAWKPLGMYHEKIGFFYNEGEKGVFFQGSANESLQAMSPEKNHESINVMDENNQHLLPHITPHKDAFEEMWKGNMNGGRVLPFPEAAKDKLIKRMPSGEFRFSIDEEIELAKKYCHQSEEIKLSIIKKGIPQIPTKMGDRDFSPLDHQREALNNWRKNNYKGVMELCTGSGKTITAIYGMSKCYGAFKRLFVIITVPYIPLAEQWEENLNLFNISPVKCWTNQNWKEKINREVGLFNSKQSDFVCLLAVNDSFASDEFQSAINNLNETDKLLFVGDECHHHNSERLLERLPKKFNLRLGLSATVEDGSPLYSYYGETVAEFGIVEAIEKKLLTKYKYIPVITELNNDEVKEYVNLSQEIGKIFAAKMSGQSVNEEYLGKLLRDRAAIIGNCRSKMEMLKKILKSYDGPKKHVLFFCSPKSSTDDYQQISQVTKILHDNKWRAGRFDYENKGRYKLLEQFKKGTGVDALVSIKCLDEGLDVPAIETAFILASSTTRKQFIQRRGRVLRKYPGKEFAVIYDFVTVVPQNSINDYAAAKKLFQREFRRFLEFSQESMNHSENYEILRPYIVLFGLEHEY